MTVAELIERLKELPQDRSVVCQVVGQDSGAWHMEFEVNNVPQSDWMVVITVSHPMLKNLDMEWGK